MILCLAPLLFLLLEGVKSPRIHFASLANFSPEFIRTVFWSLLDMKWTKYMHASVRQSITAPEIVGNDVELMQDLLSNWQHFAIVRKYGSFFLSKHYCIFIFHQQKQSFLRSREANTNSKFKYDSRIYQCGRQTTVTANIEIPTASLGYSITERSKLRWLRQRYHIDIAISVVCRHRNHFTARHFMCF